MKTVFDPKTLSYSLDYSDDIQPYSEILRQVSNAIATDREQKLHRALIELGWTPPEEGTKG